MPKLQNIGKRYHINLPREIVKAKKLQKGDEFAIVFNQDGDIVLKKVD